MSYNSSPQPLLGSAEDDDYRYHGASTKHGIAEDNTKLHEMAQITAAEDDDIEMKRPPYIHVSIWCSHDRIESRLITSAGYVCRRNRRYER